MKGSIVKRGKDRYAIILELKDDSGKRRRKWHTFHGSKREADDECTRLVGAVNGGLYIEPSKTTLTEYLDKWLISVKPNVTPKSHQRYEEICTKNIAPLIGSVILAKLKPQQLSAAYTEALASGHRKGGGGLAPRTVHHMHTVLKGALKQAVDWGLLVKNPADSVKAPKVEKTKMQTFDMAQTARAIELVRPSRMFIPTLLALLGGLRRGEVAALRWKNVDLTAGSLSVVQSAEQTGNVVRYKEPKSGKTRNVALTATMIEELRAWRLKQAQEFLRLGMRPEDETFVCTQADGCPHMPNNLTHRWSLIIAGSDLPTIRFHDLRHTHATLLLSQGVHPKVASERLGHSKIGITLDLYSHVLPGMQEDAVAKVDAALKAAQKDAR